MIFLAFVFFIGWLLLSDTRVAGFPDADRALATVVGRMLDVHDALEGAPAWERWLFSWSGMDSGEELEQAISWYEELASHSLEPAVDLHLAILEAEAGRLAAVRRRVEEWQQRDEPLPAFADAIAAAYLELDEDVVIADNPALTAIEGDWFRDRLVVALARRAGLEATLIEEASAVRGTRLLRRLRVLAGLELALVTAGLIAAVVLITRRRRDGVRRAPDASLPPPWAFRRGIVVLIRGGGAGALVAVALFVLYQLIDHPLDDFLTVPMTYLPFVPVLVLAHRHLAAPAGLRLPEAVGLRAVPSWPRLVLVAAGLVAAGIIGEWILNVIGDWRGLTSHWTEWFDRDLVWGTPEVATIAILGAVVVAPVMEEIAFRGLLYGTLRRRLPWPAAAAASAAVFAVAHGYGAIGFAAVGWSGALWAYAYERTGSLWPGIVAHGVNNAAAALTVLWLLRF